VKYSKAEVELDIEELRLNTLKEKEEGRIVRE
jgi:hypothetical protein